MLHLLRINLLAFLLVSQHRIRPFLFFLHLPRLIRRISHFDLDRLQAARRRNKALLEPPFHINIQTGKGFFHFIGSVGDFAHLDKTTTGPAYVEEWIVRRCFALDRFPQQHATQFLVIRLLENNQSTHLLGFGLFGRLGRR